MTTMKAMVYETYGPPNVLQLKAVEKPIPKHNEVLIKVQATSINDWDWGLLRGAPFINRLIFKGILKPTMTILGCDVAGYVEAVGRDVTQFQVGDAVFGDICECGWGALAEYVSVPETALALKPDKMTFAEAAATPQAAILALRGLCNKTQIRPGQKVLINGAGGGMGTFAIQIAKSLGAEVTGVDSARKLDTMRSLGADCVIDYAQEDFTKNGRVYNLILDAVAYRSIFDYKRALSPTGTYMMVGGSMPRVFQTLILGPLISKQSGQRLSILAHQPNQGLAAIKDMFEAGKVIPIVDQVYPLSKAPEAFQYFGAGLQKGKVVIEI